MVKVRYILFMCVKVIQTEQYYSRAYPFGITKRNIFELSDKHLEKRFKPHFIKD